MLQGVLAGGGPAGTSCHHLACPSLRQLLRDLHGNIRFRVLSARPGLESSPEGTVGVSKFIHAHVTSKWVRGVEVQT